MDDPPSPAIFQQAMEAFEYLRMLTPNELSQPCIGIICGSGLGGLVDTVHPVPQLEVRYQDIPHFPQSTGTCISVDPMLTGVDD